VDDPERLAAIAAALREIATERMVIFTVHPRTRDRLSKAGLALGAVRVLEPVPYLHMVDLVDGAFAVVTDSGGLQEETTALGVPCITLRENTERPITIIEGTNRLVPDPRCIPAVVRSLFRDENVRVPEGWDGRAGARVVDAVLARTARLENGAIQKMTTEGK
jgi:UDP-N-acetylglucosamine 2-epimerase (non-hydrolysing)